MAIYCPPADEGRDVDSKRESKADEATPRPQPQDEERTTLRDTISRFYNENPHMRTVQKFRTVCGDIINYPRLQMFIILLIVINAIMMGIATFSFVTDNPDVNSAFAMTDYVFLSIFTVELVMQFIFMGFTLFRDGWLVFDFIIIVLSWALEEFQIIRAFKIFRALRIITRIQTMRNLVTAVFDIMPRLGAITALLLLIFYIFAVLFTSLFGDLELSQPYFVRLDSTFMTLFVFMTMEWAECAREVMEIEGYWWAWAPFIAFVMITGFMVFNLIIAVVCDAVAVIEDNKSDMFGESSEMFGESSSSESKESIGEEELISAPDMASEEKEMVENLERRISSVLKTQKEMMTTLESLTQMALAMQPPPTRDNSHGEEDET